MRRRTPEKPRKRIAARHSAGFPRIRFGHVLLFLSGMLLMVLVRTVYETATRPAQRSVSTEGSTGARPQEQRANTSRWGDLEYMPFALDRPQEYFTNDHVFDEPTVWTFRNLDAAGLNALFESLDLDTAARAFLANMQNWTAAANGFQITVPAQVVAGIKPESRRTLYRLLSQWPENKGQRAPFQFRADGFDQWFAECGLPREKIDLVRGMMYEDGGNLYFSDVRAFSEISTHTETMCLVKSLWRVSTFILSVRLSADTDLKPLLDYWGVGGRAHQYRPLLQSMQREGTTAVPVSYFFPTFARMRLFTYPNPRDPRATREDCFWTSMNFFNEQPDDRFFDTSETLKSLQTEYLQISDGSTQFGDSLLLITPQRKALHMCVYIANDVVFTKNGGNVAQPWVLMRLNEMLASYESDHPFDMRIYRKKNLPGAPALAVR